MSRFLTTRVRILDYESESVHGYALLLLGYACVLVGQHYLATTTHQLHREALSMRDHRPLGKLVGFNILRTLVHVTTVLFIASNNLGVLIVSVLGHALGVYLVYLHQRPDHKHPVHTLVKALQHPPDDASKRDIVALLHLLRHTKTKF